jgi:hypothetical protein
MGHLLEGGAFAGADPERPNLFGRDLADPVVGQPEPRLEGGDADLGIGVGLASRSRALPSMSIW